MDDHRRISPNYIGKPHPLPTDRVVYLIELKPARALAPTLFVPNSAHLDRWWSATQEIGYLGSLAAGFRCRHRCTSVLYRAAPVRPKLEPACLSGLLPPAVDGWHQPSSSVIHLHHVRASDLQ
jgi:hypothetical protein